MGDCPRFLGHLEPTDCLCYWELIILASNVFSLNDFIDINCMILFSLCIVNHAVIFIDERWPVNGMKEQTNSLENAKHFLKAQLLPF